MLKSTAGGGGIGLTRCNSDSELRDAFETVRRQGQSFFNDSGVFLERFIARARHVEVQMFGDGQGNVVAPANGTAPCSGATRRWWRKPRRRTCRPPRARPCWMPPSPSGSR